MAETAPSESIIEFQWGQKKCLGGKRKNVQLYNSFLYDGIWYSLYDSVYLYKEGEAEPYVGKVIKIWELTDRAKKVKILWFFSPSEISNYLVGTKATQNELFIAVGEGVGLANVNPLEAIAGKCNVVCISKDKRNPQPSNEEVETADFVFYRAFDVGHHKIKEAMDERIAGVEAKYLFNRVESVIAKVISSNKEDKKDFATHSIVNDGLIPLMTKSTPVVKEHAKVNDEPLDALREKKNMSTEVLPDGKRKFGNEDSNDPSKVAGKARLVDHIADGRRPMKRAKLGNSELSKDVDEAKTVSDFEQKKASIEMSDAFGDKNKQMHHDESLARDKGLLRKLSNAKSPRLCREPLFNNDDTTQRGSAKIPPRLEIMEKRVSVSHKGGDIFRPGDLGLQELLSSFHAEDILLHEIAIDFARLRKFILHPGGCDLDTSKWFKELPWEERLQTAHEQGTLVLLQNLDPLYTSAEVEDTVRRSFNEGCSAKMIQQSASSVPHSGEAFVIFKTRESAERVVRKLDTGCLLLPNGRPLVGSFGNPCFGKRQSTFAGHLSINDPRLRLNHETKEAVATSHCSQPNTLEYDLAMEWRLLQQRSKLTCEKLFKRQEQELRRLRATLKPK